MILNAIAKINDFALKYNLKKSFTFCSENRLKSRFSLLFSDIIDCIAHSDPSIAGHQNMIVRTIDEFSQFISLGDSLVDGFFQDKSFENFIETLSAFSFIPWKVQKYLEHFPNNCNDLMIETLYKVAKCVEIEKSLTKNPKVLDEQELYDFMQIRNCDFFLFLKILSGFIPKTTFEFIGLFLNHYVVIDSLLDDITDAYQDHVNKNFNILLLDLGVIPKMSYSELFRSLLENKILEKAGLLIHNQYQTMKKILTSNSSELAKYLLFLINGCKEGFNILKKCDYFVDLFENEIEHQQVLNLLLKPYPWNRSP